MHYLITGGTGFIGSALIEVLLRGDHSVTVLSRQNKQGRARLQYVSDLAALGSDSRFDAVINLAGASLAGKVGAVALDAEDTDPMGRKKKKPKRGKDGEQV